MMPTPGFPFTAIVGQEEAKLALCLAAVYPGLGGVLLTGEKGTGKSSLVRALAGLLPEKKLINLPLNATEDRLIGGLDIEKTLSSGLARITPGLLKEAHEGFLYVDEVNLLSKTLMSYILDAAESGTVIIEREGFSGTYDSRFCLIGSMNPEEGDLPPQLLDRFGLIVSVEGVDMIRERREIVKRRLDFESNPHAFAERYREEENSLARQIRDAAKLCPSVEMTSEVEILAVNAALDGMVKGHRADILLLRAAKAFAAFNGRHSATRNDLQKIRFLVLGHRITLPPCPEYEREIPRLSPEGEGKGLTRIPAADRTDDGNPLPNETANSDGRETAPQDHGASGTGERGCGKEDVHGIGYAYQMNDVLDLSPDRRRRKPGSGRRIKTKTTGTRGRYVRYTLPKDKARDIAVDATIRAAVLRQKERRIENRDYAEGRGIIIKPDDFREKIRESRVGNMVLFLVDGSGSMGAYKRMVAAKGAILSLLQDAYQKRDQVAMMVFRERAVNLILPPTRSVDHAYRLLRSLPVGGKTPLGEGIRRSAEFILSLKAKNPDILPVIVLITDGRGNTSGTSGEKPSEEAMRAAYKASCEDIRFIVVDTETSYVKLGIADKIAAILGAAYIRLDNLEEKTLTNSLRGLIT